MSIIEELYYGNITPCDKCAKSTSEYQTFSKKFLTLETDLNKSLNAENQKRLEKLLEICFEQEAILEKDAFMRGFRLGGQIAFDIVSPYESEFE